MKMTDSFRIFRSLYYFDQLFKVGFESVRRDKGAKERDSARNGKETETVIWFNNEKCIAIISCKAIMAHWFSVHGFALVVF